MRYSLDAYCQLGVELAFPCNFPLFALFVEVGVGIGFWSRRLQKRFRVFGCDISSAALKEARHRAPACSFIRCDAMALPFSNALADAMMAFDVVEHLSEPDAFFREAARILRSGGLLVITTPNPHSLGARIKAHSGQDSRRPVSYIWEEPTHISVHATEVWRKWMERNSFRLVANGTDCLWDVPYTYRVPIRLQRLALMPFNVFFQYVIGFAGWSWGENIVCVAQRN